MAVAQIGQSQAVELRSNPGFYLRADAQKAWDRSTAAFGKIPIISLGGALRLYEIQERIFLERYDRGNLAGRAGYTTDVRWWPARGSYYTRKVGTAAAAVPGTSNHGGGVAVDVKTRRESGDPSYDTHVIFASWDDVDRTRFLRVAAEHGWDDDEGRSVGELWHLTYYPERDQHRGDPVPAPPKKETFLMALSDSKQNELAEDANTAAVKAGQAVTKVARVEGDLGGEVLIGPWNSPKEQKRVSHARAARINWIQSKQANDGVKALRAELRALRTTVDTLAKGLQLDPKRIYEMLDKNLQEATADLKITFSAEDAAAEEEENAQ